MGARLHLGDIGAHLAVELGLKVAVSGVSRVEMLVFMVGFLSVLSHFESFLHRIGRFGASFCLAVVPRDALEEICFRRRARWLPAFGALGQPG